MINVFRKVVAVRILFSIFLICLSFPVSSFAMNVGEPLPVEISGPTQSGEVKTLEAVQKQNGSVLFFVRSLDWCPYCQSQVLELRDHAEQFLDKGYQPVVISYDEAAMLKNFAQKNDISFPLMSDENSKIIKALGILNDEFEVGSSYYGIPHPTIFVVDEQGVILKKFSEESYKNRPSLKMVLQELP